jgi:hypothetical protein
VSDRPDNLVNITDAATACGVNVKTVRRWLREGAPQVQPGRRGRGGQALLDPSAIEAWRAARNGTGGSTAALEVLAADAPEILAREVWRTFQFVEHDLTGHARRTLAGALAVVRTRKKHFELFCSEVLFSMGYLVGRVGIEPTTKRLRVVSSLPG